VCVFKIRLLRKISHLHEPDLRRERPAPPHERDPIIPEDIEALILKCFEKDPTNRFQSAAELEAALTRGEGSITPWKRNYALVQVVLQARVPDALVRMILARSGRLPIIVVQHSTQPRAALDGCSPVSNKLFLDP